MFHEHEKELIREGDEVIILFAEVMFDKKNNVSGHNPDVMAFVHKAKGRFEAWGYKVEIVRSDMDYLDLFYHRLTRSPDPTRVGKIHGFFPAGICDIKRDLKLKPMEDYIESLNGEVLQYVGIAVDEKERLKSLSKFEGRISLLMRYGLTEADAYSICKKYGLLSPNYGGGQKRDGCWFCANAKLCEHRVIRNRYPEAWKKYVSLEDIPDLAYKKWNPYSCETLHDREDQLNFEDRQIDLFELFDLSDAS